MPVHVCFLKLDQRLSCVAYKNIYVCRCVCVWGRLFTHLFCLGSFYALWLVSFNHCVNTEVWLHWWFIYWLQTWRVDHWVLGTRDSRPLQGSCTMCVTVFYFKWLLRHRSQTILCCLLIAEEFNSVQNFSMYVLCGHNGRNIVILYLYR